MGKIGVPELLVILVIILVIFGPAKLPEIGKAMGESISQFKSSVNKDHSEEEEKEETK